MNGGGIGVEGGCREFEMKSGTDQIAIIAVAGALDGWLAGEMGWCADLIPFENLYLKILPEIVGPELVRLRCARASRCGGGDDGAVGVGKKDFDGDFDGFLMAAVIQCGLLRAVVSDERVRIVNELSERGEQCDRANIRTGFWRREVLGIFVKEARECAIVALAEEIGFADGFVRQRGVEGEGRRNQKKSGEDERESRSPECRHGQDS